MSDDGIDRFQFNVVVFYVDDTHQYLCRSVSASMAAEIFTDVVVMSEGAPEMVSRVIITDGGDGTAREWTQGKGITIP